MVAVDGDVISAVAGVSVNPMFSPTLFVTVCPNVGEKTGGTYGGD